MLIISNDPTTRGACTTRSDPFPRTKIRLLNWTNEGMEFLKGRRASTRARFREDQGKNPEESIFRGTHGPCPHQIPPCTYCARRPVPNSFTAFDPPTKNAAGTIYVAGIVPEMMALLEFVISEGERREVASK